MNSNKEKGKTAPLRVPYDSFLPERLREVIDKEVEDIASLLGVSVRIATRLYRCPACLSGLLD